MPGFRSARVLLLVIVAIIAAYVLARGYWDQYQVEAFCEDQVVVGSSSDGLAASAAALGFRVRAGASHDDATGLILIHKETLFGTYYCDVQHIKGKIATKSTGWF